jgi:hypothetical protein
MQKWLSIQKNWENFLNEQQRHFVVNIVLKYENDFNLYGHVFNKIRAIDGITITRAADPGVIDVGEDRQRVNLTLKFIPTKPMRQYLEYLRSKLISIKDEDGDRVKSVKIVNLPSLLDKK